MHVYRFFPLSPRVILELEKNDKNCDALSLDNILQDKNEDQFDDLSEIYRDLRKIRDSLVSKKLWASNLSTFNDLFEQIAWIKDKEMIEKSYLQALNEGKTKIKKFKKFKSKVKQDPTYSNGYFEHKWAEVYRHYGVVCFCEDWNNPLMWGHYANGNFGVCIEYKLHDSLVDSIKNKKVHLQNYNNNNEERQFCFIFKAVSYEDQPEIWCPKMQEHYKKEYNRSSQNNSKVSSSMSESDYMVIASNMFSKSKHWSYEKEIRMVFIGTPESIPIDKVFVDNLNTPALTISKVICGYKLNPKMIKILKNSVKLNAASFVQASPKGGSFLFELKKI